MDGNRNSDYHAGSCSHTQETSAVWWMVDLEENVTITNVIITSRIQGSKSELRAHSHCVMYFFCDGVF